MSSEIVQNRKCVVIPGILATDHKMQAVGFTSALRKYYGNVTVFNSSISTDTPNPNRRAKLKQELADNEEGLTLATHSLGSAEVDPSALEMIDQDKLRLVPISPSGYARGLEKIVYIAKLVGDKLPLRMGFHSLAAFPPENISPEAIREMFGRYSNANKGFEVVPTIQVHPHRDKLTDVQQEALCKTDAELEQAIRDKRKIKAKQLLRRRGGKKVVGEPLRQFYNAAPDGKKRRIHIGGIVGLRTLFRATSTRPMQEMRSLIAAGYQVDPFITEYDIVSPRWLTRMYATPEEARGHIRILAGMTHDSILFQSASFAAVVAEGDRPSDAIMTA